MTLPDRVPEGTETAGPRRRGRRPAGRALKRDLILEAARAVFETEGLDGASLRAIAAKAGYTPAALYFHFESKEAIYAAVLQASMDRLGLATRRRVARAADPAGRLRAAALGFFEFYEKNPRDLDLGFYLFRGGMKPRGLGPEHDRALNAALAAQLEPIAAAAQELGAPRAAAERLMVDCFAHAAGLLLLAHTGRIRMFGASAPQLMAAYLEEKLAQLGAVPRG
ncbi:MAG: helix-turn-helix domain-containing protein [Tistlia sp.]